MIYVTVLQIINLIFVDYLIFVTIMIHEYKYIVSGDVTDVV